MFSLNEFLGQMSPNERAQWIQRALSSSSSSSTAATSRIISEISPFDKKLETYLNGCPDITSCSCTNDSIRKKFDAGVTQCAEDIGLLEQRGITILHLGAGNMKQVFSNSLRLMEVNNKIKIRVIAIEPRLMFTDNWEQCVDIYIDPQDCEIEERDFPNGTLRFLAQNNHLPKGDAIYCLDGVIYDIENGKSSTPGSSLDSAYYSKRNIGAENFKNYLKTINNQIDLDKNGKLIVTDNNRDVIKAFLKNHMHTRGIIASDAEKVLHQTKVVEQRIKQEKGDHALTVSVFTSVFSYYLACHPERAEIMSDRNKFEQTFNAFNERYPDSSLVNFNVSIAYVSCLYDQEQNPDLIKSPRLLALDLAVSIDLEPARDKMNAELDCFQGIMAGNKFVKDEDPVILSAQKLEKFHGTKDVYSDELFTPEEKFKSQGSAPKLY